MPTFGLFVSVKENAYSKDLLQPVILLANPGISYPDQKAT
jgi:hypothetical protein